MKSNAGRAAGILLAGGKGSRARLSGNKAYFEVGDAPMISHSLRTLDRSPWIVDLVLVIRPQDRQLAEEVIGQSEITTALTVVSGGASRHQSEFSGLEALSDRIGNSRLDLVAIHDGARPFLSEVLLEELFRQAHLHGGAVPTMPLEGPTFGVSEQGDLMVLGRGRLHRAQTPQVFEASALLAAYHLAQKAGFEGGGHSRDRGTFLGFEDESRARRSRQSEIHLSRGLSGTQHLGLFAGGWLVVDDPVWFGSGMLLSASQDALVG